MHNYSKRVRPLLKINLAQWICNHLVGKEHTHGHRIFVGSIIMVIGLWIGDVFVPPIHILALITKGFGGIVDGIGLVPIIEYAIMHGSKKELEQEVEIIERELAEQEIVEKAKKRAVQSKETVK